MPHKGYKQSEEHKRKHALSRIGIPAWNKGMKGFHHSGTFKKGHARFENIPSGDKHYMWKGGVTLERKKIYFTKEYKLWRNSIFERDNFTCVHCGQVGGNLNADHIKPFSLFPELRFELSNGRTLCIPCHRKTETYGRAMMYRIKL